MSNYRDKLESWLKEIEVEAESVFDVGGKELPVKDRVKSWEVKEYKILDLPEYDINVRHDDYYMESNIVFCLEVMEYIWQPKIAIQNLYDLLIDEGLLYITFPFLYPIHQPVDVDYLRYTKHGAIKLLTEAEFKILDIIPRTMKPEGQALMRQFRIAEGMHAAKGIVHNELGWIIKCQKI